MELLKGLRIFLTRFEGSWKTSAKIFIRISGVTEGVRWVRLHRLREKASPFKET